MRRDGGLTREEASELTMESAPAVEAFLVELFGLEGAVAGLRSETEAAEAD